MNFKTIFFVFLIFISCTIQSIHTENELIHYNIYGILNPDYDYQIIIFDSILSIEDSSNNSAIKSANVLLNNNICSFDSINNYYTISKKIANNKEYQLKIIYNNDTIIGNTIIPDKISFYPMINDSDSISVQSLPFLSWNRTLNAEYAFFVFEEDSMGELNILFKMYMTDDTIFSLNIIAQFFTIGNYYDFLIMNLDENYFNYAMGNNIFNNSKGVFGSMSSDYIKRIKIIQ